MLKGRAEATTARPGTVHNDKAPKAERHCHSKSQPHNKPPPHPRTTPSNRQLFQACLSSVFIGKMSNIVQHCSMLQSPRRSEKRHARREIRTQDSARIYSWTSVFSSSPSIAHNSHNLLRASCACSRHYKAKIGQGTSVNIIALSVA